MIFSKDILIGVILALLIAGAVGGFNYWQELKEKRLDEVASLVYLYEKGRLKAEEVEPKVKGTPYYPYFLAIKGEKPSLVRKFIEDEEVKKLFLEKEAYTLYEGKKYEESLKKLSSITEKDFNHPSAILLRAFIEESKGNVDKARELYEGLRAKFGNTYFSNIAYGRLLMLGK